MVSKNRTVWVYTTSEGDLKVFSTEDAANDWFERNDPEGTALEYPVLDEPSKLATHEERWIRH